VDARWNGVKAQAGWIQDPGLAAASASDNEGHQHPHRDAIFGNTLPFALVRFQHENCDFGGSIVKWFA